MTDGAATPRAGAEARNAVLLAIALIVLAWIENAYAPWSPFYVVYAGLTTLLPFVFGGLRFTPLGRIGWKGWLAVVGTAIGFQALGIVWQGIAYPQILVASGVPQAAQTGPMYEFGAAFMKLFTVVAERWRADPGSLLAIYLVFIFVWAGLGEEVFYRGYLHERLERASGFGPAALLSAVLFSVRHATQFALLGREYPWPVIGMWLVIAFALGLWMSFLYKRTGSLTVPVLAHYGFNAIPTLLFLLGPRPTS